MKKLILLLALALCPFLGQSAVVPGSSFPVVNPPSNSMTLLLVYTNGGLTPGNLSTSSNAQWRVDDMVSYLSSIINPTFPWLIVTNGSSTATIQAQFNSLTSGGVVSIQPGSYTITAPIAITNSMYVFGDGATFNYGTSLTNFMLDTGTNYQKALVIDNMIFDGGIAENYAVTNYSSMFNGSLEPYYSPFWTNHSGLRVECSGGVRVQNCTFRNWSGNGCLALQAGGTLQAQNHPKFEFLFNRCYTNFIGLFVPGASYEVPGYNNAPIGDWIDSTAEYGLIEGNDIFNNQRGIIAGAGNLLVQGNTINGNWHGIDIFTGSNPGHGRYCGNTLNHNYFAIYTEATSGGLWQDNQMLANNAIVFNNTATVTFRNNSIGKAALTFTNGTTGTIVNNVWDSTAIWGQPFNTPGVETNIEPQVLISGNMSGDRTNNDGTTLSATMRFNGLTSPSNMPPVAADYKGQMFYWNSNGANIFIIKSSAGGTAWTTTNLIN